MPRSFSRRERRSATIDRSTSTTRRWSALLAGFATAALLFVAGPVAPASAADDPNWWWGKYRVDAARSAGLTGEGVKVAVIDAGINPDLSVFEGSRLTVHEPGMCGSPAATSTATTDSVHGSDVAALLVGNGTGPGSVRGIAPGVELSFYASPISSTPCLKKVDGTTTSDIGAAIRLAVADGNRIISVSLGSTDQYDGDFAAIAEALARGVVIVAAGENTTGQVGGSFPQRANGVVSVNAMKSDGSLQTQNDGTPVAFDSTTVIAAGWGFSSQAAVSPSPAWGDNQVRLRGASLATPLVSGMLALVAQKYPKATGNQLLQSLIHNTGADDHELKRYTGGYGYGPASLSHLLRVDPTSYPDVNPLMDEPDHLGQPTAAQVSDARAALGGEQPGDGSNASSPAAAPGSGGDSPPVAPILWAAGAIGGLVVVAVIVIVIVLLSRRRGVVSRGGLR